MSWQSQCEKLSRPLLGDNRLWFCEIDLAQVTSDTLHVSATEIATQKSTLLEFKGRKVLYLWNKQRVVRPRGIEPLFPG